MDASNERDACRTLHISCKPCPSGRDLFYVLSFYDDSGEDSSQGQRAPLRPPCYRATCILEPRKRNTKPASVVVTGTSREAGNRTQVLPTGRDAVYQLLFHTGEFRVIESVLRCDAEGILLACSFPEVSERQDRRFGSSDFEPGSSLNKRETVAFDVVGQSMLLWIKLRMGGRSSLPTEYFDIEFFDQELAQARAVEHLKMAPFGALLEVERNDGNGLITARVQAFREHQCLFRMRVTVALSAEALF